MSRPQITSRPRAGAGGAQWSWQRFVRLAHAHWTEQRRAYLGHLLACGILYAVLLVFVLGLASAAGFATSVQTAFYFGGLFLTGFVFAARYFDGMARRESALLLLMRPASLLEKWLLCVLVVAVAYPLAYTLLFLAMSWPVQQLVLALSALQLQSRELDPRGLELFIPLQPPPAGSSRLTVPQQVGLFIGAAALQAVAVSGALYFRRAALLKTVVLIFGLLMLTALLVAVSGAQGDVLLAWWLPHPGAQDWAVHVVNTLLWLGLPALLWLQALVHLREKELA